MTQVIDMLKPYACDQVAAFSKKLIPSTSSTILGLKTPEIKEVARQVDKDEELKQAFLQELPHSVYEEYQVHSQLIGRMKDIDQVFSYLDKFLYYVDNWAVSDSLKIPVFKKHPRMVHEKLMSYISSEREYTRRYGIVILMNLYLDENFQASDLYRIAEIQDDRYYVNMARAWYFCDALIKQYSDTVILLEEKKLSPWVANKTIQKAVESFRIDDSTKAYLRTLKIK